MGKGDKFSKNRWKDTGMTQDNTQEYGEYTTQIRFNIGFLQNPLMHNIGIMRLSTFGIINIFSTAKKKRER